MNDINNLVDALESIQALTVFDFNLDDEKFNFPDKIVAKLPTSIVEPLSSISNVEIFWMLKRDSSKIVSLKSSVPTMGNVKINLERISQSLRDGFNEDPDDIFKSIFNDLDKNNFIVIDDLYPNHLVGYIIDNDKIEDNLFMITVGDNNIYNLSLNTQKYMDIGYSCGFFYGWQMLFVDSEVYNEKTKQLGYYVPQILPKDIHEPFMQKFRERFGEIEYKPEDYR